MIPATKLLRLIHRPRNRMERESSKSDGGICRNGENLALDGAKQETLEARREKNINLGVCMTLVVFFASKKDKGCFWVGLA